MICTGNGSSAGRQSIFTAPSVDLLLAPTCQDANSLLGRNGCSQISARAYAFRTKIVDVQPVAEQDCRIYEVHPEYRMAEQNGVTTLRWQKASWNGLCVRPRIRECDGIVLPDYTGGPGEVSTADPLDAAIAAWSAAGVAGGEAEGISIRHRVSEPSGGDHAGSVVS